MESAKTLLITGGSGFLGTWLAETANQAGYQVIGIDLRAPIKPVVWYRFATASLEVIDLNELLSGLRLFAVLHLAGGASVQASVSDPYGDFSSLLPGTARLGLFIAKYHPQARMLFFSSAAVYGNPISLPITESSPTAPVSPYGIHKAISETLLEHYSKVLGLQVTVLRIFSVFGPGLRKQLIWDICEKASSAHAIGQREISLYGTGFETRDFIFVEDVCNAILRLLSLGFTERYEVFNLSSGTETPIHQVAESLVKHLQFALEIKFEGNIRKGDPLNWQGDICKLSKLGFQPSFSMDTGLHHTVSWFKLQNTVKPSNTF